MNHKLTSMLVSIAALCVASGAYAQDEDPSDGWSDTGPSTMNSDSNYATADDEVLSDAREQVDEATEVVKQMKRDPGVALLLEKAYGVFIIPDYAKAAAVVGAQGGEGVVLLREQGTTGEQWSAPAFFDFGGASIGAEVGVKAGSIVMLLMSEEAADMFTTHENNWSLDANAGLTIVNYAAAGEASAGKGDVILWSDTEGAYAGADIGVSDISRDEDENGAYYSDESVDARQILTGEVSTYHADRLRAALRG